MNVAIFGVNQVSEIVAKIIEQILNPLLNEKLYEPIKVTSFVTGGQSRLNQAHLVTLQF